MTSWRLGTAVLAATAAPLTACGSTSTGASSSSPPLRLLTDAPTADATTTRMPAEDELGPPWHPDDYSEFTADVAGKWIRGGKDPCGVGPKCWYWTLDVVTRGDCPDGVYVKANLIDNGTVVDDTIDSVSSLRAGQRARLQFWTYNRSVDDLEVTSVSCY